MAGGLLVALGYQPALAAEISRFLGAIAWAAPSFLGFAVLRSFLVAASHSRTVMIALILCIPMNAGLNWILVFGPPRGAGSGHCRLRLRDGGDPMADVYRSRILRSRSAEPRPIPNEAIVARLGRDWAYPAPRLADRWILGLEIGVFAHDRNPDGAARG